MIFKWEVHIDLYIYSLIVVMYVGGEIECTVEDVMAFFSGASEVPPLGFEKQPTIVFNHANNSILTTVSTCDLKMRLPTIHGSDYEKFKDALFLSIRGNDGFAGV